ncbi:hypothetical protein F511_04239 [Dorcoceras hygrometricum]|nr:hypothetical protein F511_04239 [Dorcoceras hygrometricum]
MLRAALGRTPAASCAAHGAGCANLWRNVCLVGRQPIAQPCEEEQHSIAKIRPPPRNTCAQDLVIGHRSLAQRVAHTSSNWSASGCASLHEAAATIGTTLAGTNSGEARRRRRKAAAATAFEERREAAEVALPKSSSYAQHIELSIRTLARDLYTIVSSDNIGYPLMSASGESSTTMHRLLHASGSHPIPPPNDPKTNHYNQELGLIHSTNGNHLESPNEGSSIDHQLEKSHYLYSAAGSACLLELLGVHLERVSVTGWLQRL